MSTYQINQELSSEVYKLKDSNLPLEKYYASDGTIWSPISTYSSHANNLGDLENGIIKNIHTIDGYAGAIYVNDQTKELIIVNAGTRGILDLVSDAQMALGMKPLQYIDAMNIVQDAINLAREGNYSISTTGHSLGGSLAQYQAKAFGIPATTFNAYGVDGTTGISTSAATNLYNLLIDLAAADPTRFNQSSTILNFKTSADIIGNAGTDLGVIQTISNNRTMYDTVVETMGLMIKDSLQNDYANGLKDLSHLLYKHGIAEFGYRGTDYEIISNQSNEVMANPVSNIGYRENSINLDLTYTGSTWGAANSNRFSELINFATDNLNNNGRVSILLTDRDLSGGIDGLIKARDSIYTIFGDTSKYKITEQTDYINGISYADDLLKNIEVPWSLYRSLLTICKRRRLRLHGIFNLV